MDLWNNLYFFLTWIDGYSGYGLVFPLSNASLKATIHEFMECLFHHSTISHSIAAHSGIHFRAREVQEWTHIHVITGLYM